MKSRTTREFRDMLERLPETVQRQARAAYKLFEQNPAHPGLRFKKVCDDPALYSARVGIGYRAVGVMNEDAVLWIWIGSHAAYDELLARL